MASLYEQSLRDSGYTGPLNVDSLNQWLVSQGREPDAIMEYNKGMSAPVVSSPSLHDEWGKETYGPDQWGDQEFMDGNPYLQALALAVGGWMAAPALAGAEVGGASAFGGTGVAAPTVGVEGLGVGSGVGAGEALGGLSGGLGAGAQMLPGITVTGAAPAAFGAGDALALGGGALAANGLAGDGWTGEVKGERIPEPEYNPTPVPFVPQGGPTLENADLSEWHPTSLNQDIPFKSIADLLRSGSSAMSGSNTGSLVNALNGTSGSGSNMPQQIPVTMKEFNPYSGNPYAKALYGNNPYSTQSGEK